MQKFLAFLPFTLANLDQIQETLKEVEEFQSPTGSRSLTSLQSVGNLNNYGCWCYFEESTYVKGKGVPTDDYDRECKKYNQGFQCIMMEDATCSPYSKPYSQPPNLAMAGLGFANVDIETECAVLNAGDECAIDTCVVESNFALAVTKLTSGGVSLTVSSFHTAGFPLDSTCTPIQSNVQGPRDSCCGEYPTKFPFRSLGGLQECCSDGKVRATGGC